MIKFCRFCQTPIEDPTADVCCNELRLFNENVQLKLKLKLMRKKLTMAKANTFKHLVITLLRHAFTKLSSSPITNIDDALTECAIQLRMEMRDRAEIELLVQARNWATTLAVETSGSRDVASYLKWCNVTKTKQQLVILQRMIDHALANLAS